MNTAEALVQRAQQLEEAFATGTLTPEEKVRALASIYLPMDQADEVISYMSGVAPENGTKALFMADVAYQRLKAQQEAERRLAGENYSGSTAMTWDDLEAHKTSFLVQDLIADNSVHFLVARPNLGKTFTFIDMACRMATGMEWLGKKTRQAQTLIVLGEGVNGFMDRVKAWMEAHGKTREDLEPWIHFHEGMNLNNDEALDILKKRVAETQAELVIFDTWSNTSGVVDEERNGLNNEVLRRVTEALHGQALLFVHHPRKSDQDGDSPVMRGAGALYGRAEVVMTLWQDRGFTSPDGTKRNWMALSTEVAHAGKNRLAQTETIHGLYLSEDHDAPVFMQAEGEVLSAQSRKVRQVLTEPMTVTAYEKAAGVSEATARRHLSKAVEEGVAELHKGAGQVPDSFHPSQRWASLMSQT